MEALGIIAIIGLLVFIGANGPFAKSHQALMNSLGSTQKTTATGTVVPQTLEQVEPVTLPYYGDTSTLSLGSGGSNQASTGSGLAGVQTGGKGTVTPDLGIGI